MNRAHVISAAIAAAGLTLAASGANAQVVTCAVEGQICRVPAAATVFFGVPGRTTSIVASGPVACNNATFGRDPAPGVRKGCSYVLDGGRGSRGGRGFEERGRGRDRDFGDRRRSRDLDDDGDDEPRRPRPRF